MKLLMKTKMSFLCSMQHDHDSTLTTATIRVHLENELSHFAGKVGECLCCLYSKTTSANYKGNEEEII